MTNDQKPATNQQGSILSPPNLINHAWKTARRIVVSVIGFTILLFGIALLFLPGPAFIVIPVGLGVLATEFLWARRLLREAKRRGQSLGEASGLFKSKSQQRTPSANESQENVPAGTPKPDPRSNE